MSTIRPSSHSGQFLVAGQSRIFLEDLSDNAKLQMVNIQAVDDQITNLNLRLNMLRNVREEFANRLYSILKADGLLD